jgi:subtilase family serine protease
MDTINTPTDTTIDVNLLPPPTLHPYPLYLLNGLLPDSNFEALEIPQPSVYTAIQLSGALTPPQVAKAYQVPYVSGHGVKIGIMSFGGGFKQSDFNASFNELKASGLIPSNASPPTIKQVLLNGQSGAFSNNGGSDTENTLDIYAIGTIVPEADITIYIGSLFDSLITRMLQDECQIISVSWGFKETASIVSAYESFVQLVESKKSSIFVASGDYGSVQQPSDTILSNTWPSTSPNAVSVGGTKLTLDTSTLPGSSTYSVINGGFTITASSLGMPVGGTFANVKVGDILQVYSVSSLPVKVASVDTVTYQSITLEKAFGGTTNSALPHNYIWTCTDSRYAESDDNRDINFGSTYGGGGGISTIYTAPAFQTGLSYTPIVNGITQAPRTLSMRGVPDPAAPMNLYLMYVNGVVTGTGGTSASTPVLVGILARLLQLSGVQLSSVEYNTLFYTIKNTAFYDITVGTNNTAITSGYAGTTSWDPVTGLGPPKGPELYAALRPTFTYPKFNLGFRSFTYSGSSRRQWPRPKYSYSDRHAGIFT